MSTVLPIHSVDAWPILGSSVKAVELPATILRVYNLMSSVQSLAAAYQHQHLQAYGFHIVLLI